MQNLERIHLPGERHVAAWASPFPYLEAGAVSFQTCHNVWGRSVRQIFSCDVGLCLCLWHLEVHPMLSQLEVFVFSPSSRAGDIQRTPCSLFFLLGVWFTSQLCLAILGWPCVKSFNVRFILLLCHRGLVLFTTASFSARRLRMQKQNELKSDWKVLENGNCR